MKKVIITLSVAFVLSSNAQAHSFTNTIETPIVSINSAAIADQHFEVQFRDGSFLSGEIAKISEGNYVYTSYLFMNGQHIGGYNLYFETELIGSTEVVIASSMYARYSNSSVETEMNASVSNVLKTKHDTAKNSIGNIR